MATLLSADVAELADAQVSEACDGDIVEVQVLSSAPAGRAQLRARLFLCKDTAQCRPIAVSPRRTVSASLCLPSARLSPSAGNKKTCHGIYQAGVFVIEVSLKGEF